MLRYVVTVALITLSAAAWGASEAHTQILAACEIEWPKDYRMQKFCVDKQSEALLQVGELLDQGNTNKILKDIVADCLNEWPAKSGGYNWRMVKFCSDKQMKAYRELHGK